MNNIPVVKLGLIAVSRDCFPIQLSEKRRAAIKETYKGCLLYTSPSPRDAHESRMPSSA